MRGRKAADAVILPKSTRLSKELHSLAMQEFAYVAKLCVLLFQPASADFRSAFFFVRSELKLGSSPTEPYPEQRVSESATCETAVFGQKLRPNNRELMSLRLHSSPCGRFDSLR